MHTCVIVHNKSFAVVAHSLWFKLHFQLHGLSHTESSNRWLYRERPVKHVETHYQNIFPTIVREERLHEF